MSCADDPQRYGTVDVDDEHRVVRLKVSPISPTTPADVPSVRLELRALREECEATGYTVVVDH